MASVVSMLAWRRIFCATEGWTLARASSVAVVWRSEWKTMPFFGRGRIQSARPSVGQRRFALSSAFSTWPQRGGLLRCRRTRGAGKSGQNSDYHSHGSSSTVQGRQRKKIWRSFLMKVTLVPT